MRAGIQIAATSVVGALLIFGCSTSDSDVANVAGAAGIPPASDGGARGNEDRAGAGGTAGTAGASGHNTDDVAGAGAGPDAEAGAGGACAGVYQCPLVGYGSSATITFDLPLSVADAADAVFTACRNSECHSAKGSATVVPNKPMWGWAEEVGGSSIYLTFDGSGAAPFGVLRWDFMLDYVTISTDHYTLTVQPVGASSPVTVFDTQVDYTTVVDDPTLVDEGFCHRCSEVSIADLDLRASN